MNEEDCGVNEDVQIYILVTFLGDMMMEMSFSSSFIFFFSYLALKTVTVFFFFFGGDYVNVIVIYCIVFVHK